MPGGLTTEQLALFAILLVAFGLLATERLRTDAVALLIIVALVVTRVLGPEEALAGFSSEPAIVIAAIFVLSTAFQRTGLSDMLGRWIGRLAGHGLTRMLAVIMPSSALLSAFTHHVTITAVMLPVTLSLARERGVPASKLLMPMAIASSLGTTNLIIAAPSFLIASELIRQAGRPALGMFSLAPIGLSLTAAGTLFMLLVGRFLLPERRANLDPTSRFRLDEYVTELRILPNSPFLEKTIDQVEADKNYHLAVLGWVRGRQRLRPPFGDRHLRDGDVLLVRTTPDELVAIRHEAGVELEPVAHYQHETPSIAGDGQVEDFAEQLVQTIVAPGSGLAGRTAGELDFRRRYGVLVLGLWRKDRLVEEELARTRLQVGDVLVLQGDDDALARVASDRDFLMMVPFHGEARRPRKALLAGGIMLGTILVATFHWLSLAIAALAGAGTMVLARCITPRQAYRAIDGRMYIFIAGAVPLGTAMKKSGAAELLAGALQGIVGGWSQLLILLALFAVVGTVVQFMGSDAATTALFGPIAVALAQALGQPPEPYVVAVAMAAVTAVLTPMSHHNLLIYAPGGYRFSDFFRVGAPVTLLIGLIVATLAPRLWPG